MKRQSVRKLIIFISLLLFPIIQYYFSPVLILAGASEGIINASFIIFSLLFVISIFFGRIFCGWLAPCGGLQEACFNISDKPAKGGRLNMIKFFIWIPWLVFIAMLAFSADGYRKIDFFYSIDNGISISSSPHYIIYYSVLFLFVLIPLLFGKRSMCHYGCWMSPFMITGINLRKFLNLPSLRLKSNLTKCIKCGVCTKVCPMSLDVALMVEQNRIDDHECILCGECVDGCKSKAIGFTFGREQKNAKQG